MRCVNGRTWRRAAQKNKKRGYEWRRKGITKGEEKSEKGWTSMRQRSFRDVHEAANNSCLKASADMLYGGLHLFPTRCFLSFSFEARSALKGRGKKKRKRSKLLYSEKKNIFEIKIVPYRLKILRWSNLNF